MSLTAGASTEPTSTETATSTRQMIPDKPRLVLLSFLMLFLELAIIRWSGANVVYLAYFSNLVLLGSFLGLGFLWAGRGGRPLFPWTPVVLAALIAFIRFFPIDIRVTGSQLIFFNDLHSTGPPRELVLPVIFLAVAGLMAFVADGVATTFKRFEPLEAYKLDLAGSVLGILAVSALAFLRQPPLAWGLVASVVLLLLALPKFKVLPVLALAGVLLMLGAESMAHNTTWSPYYKIQYAKNDAGGYSVKVNSVPHQASLPVANNPLYGSNYEQANRGKPGDVLIIGAGGGNDVAAALEKGATHVDTVEIDRRLYELGRDGHPDHPYQDPRVSVHIDDGRAFLERSHKHWDRILLALPDSLTLVTGNASVRLESYLFTQEAVEAARNHLKPDGVFSMYNYYREKWLVDRYAGTLDTVFKHAPCVENFDQNSNLAVLTVSRNPSM